MRTAIVSLLDLAVALTVFFDAKHLGIRYGGRAGTEPRLGAVGWALGCLIMPPFYLPAYVIRRIRYLREIAREGSTRGVYETR
jgi:hypothetical protein